MRRSIFHGVAGLLLIVGCASPPAPRSHVIAEYESPLTSPGAKFAALPASVQNTIRAETGAAEIADILKYTESGRVIYATYFANGQLYPPLFIAADGSVLNPDFTLAVGAPRDETAVLTGAGASGLRFADLPEPVVKTVDEYSPRSGIASLDKETWGSRVVYIISFRDEHKPRLYVASDGTILRDVQK